MSSFVKKSTVVLSTLILMVGLNGCDLINPPKKETKKAKPAEVAQQPKVEDNAPLTKDVIARVGTWVLTTEQFDQRLKLLKEGLPEFDANKPGSKEAVLNELIRQQLLVKDAEAQGIGDQKDVTEAVEDFRRTLLVQDLASKVTKDVVATEKDAQDYYAQNKDLFVDPIQWSVREIVVADEVTAKGLLVQVLQGGDFGEIAKTQSKGKTAATGGVLPVFTKPPFDALGTAIASLEVGATSAVVKGPEGYYIVKVDGKKGGAMKAFAEVKADLISGLTLRKQQEAILQHIDELASKTKVEINKDLLSPASK